ncbi:MAG: DUF1206 domain-containing protein [Anaerolineae bacterium]
MATLNIKQQATNKAKHTAGNFKRATANPWVERLERFGYITRGVVYATIGILALQLALGTGGAATTQTGAIARLGGQPFGKALLILIAVGLASYSLWGFIRAIFDPLHRGNNLQGRFERVGFAFSGLSYGLLVIPTVQFIMNQGASQQVGGSADISAQLFKLPFGMGLVVGFGLFWIGIGLWQLYTAYRGAFMKDFQVDKMSASERTWATRLGKFGHAARGIVFAVIGVLIVEAALAHNPSQAQGFDSALLRLAQAPYGMLVLGGVALGLVAFGIYSAFSARWIKVRAA